MTLSPTDFELLETLSCRVSVLTLGLAANFVGASSRRGAARRRLMRLTRAGWIELYVANAHPLLPVEQPLFAWQPGDNDPNPLLISRAARERWIRAARPTEICVPSKRCSSLYGSAARCRATLSHLDHDLRLASVYLHYRMHRPTLARQWIGEHVLPKAGYRIKDPDAFILDDLGGVLCVVESAGRYSSAQVESFHEYCADNRLHYELW